jgi:hypothetical protein
MALVGGDQDEAMAHGLDHQQAIERVAMLPGQLAGIFRTIGSS